MQHLSDLLPDNLPQEPSEFMRIKNFIRENIGCESSLSKRNGQIIIAVPDSISAFNLRLRYFELQKSCGVKEKLFIKIQTGK